MPPFGTGTPPLGQVFAQRVDQGVALAAQLLAPRGRDVVEAFEQGDADELIQQGAGQIGAARCTASRR